MSKIWKAFVERLAVHVSRVDGSGSVYGRINSIQKEDGSPNKNFIVRMDDGRWLYFRLETDVVVTFA